MGNRGSKLFFSIAAALLFVGSGAKAQPSCEDLKKNWYARYISDFKVRWNTDTFDCEQESKAALAYYDLETIKFNVNAKGFSPDFYNVVKNLVTDTYLDLRCQAIAYVRGDTGKMALCPAFFADDREDRASTIVHESRHIQKDDQNHVTCTGGKYYGRGGACDEKFYDGQWAGSGYNIDIFYMGWVIHSSKPNELSKSILQSYLNGILPDRFNVITAEQVLKWRK